MLYKMMSSQVLTTMYSKVPTTRYGSCHSSLLTDHPEIHCVTEFSQSLIVYIVFEWVTPDTGRSCIVDHNFHAQCRRLFIGGCFRCQVYSQLRLGCYSNLNLPVGHRSICISLHLLNFLGVSSTNALLSISLSCYGYVIMLSAYLR